MIILHKNIFTVALLLKIKLNSLSFNTNNYVKFQNTKIVLLTLHLITNYLDNIYFYNV